MQTELDMAQLHPIIVEVLASGGEFRLHPRGVSMLPFLRPGKDSVVLVPVGELAVNGMYLYRRKNGKYVLHRLIALTAEGAPVFRGDNQLGEEHGVEAGDIIAAVGRIYKGEQVYFLDSPKYRRYLWRLNNPFCRFVRFFPRRIRRFLKRKFRK